MSPKQLLGKSRSKPFLHILSDVYMKQYSKERTCNVTHIFDIF